jgi:nitronate monooxygenase
MSNSPQTKKWFKMFVQLNGMKKLEQSVLPNNYQTLWCAGKSVELIDSIIPCADIIAQIKAEYNEKLEELRIV